VSYRDKTRVLLTEEQLHARVKALGVQITSDYAGEELVVVSVLKGSFVFVADLVRAIDLPIRVEFLGVRSYGDSTVSSGVVQVTQDLTRPIDGAHVLVVEDIVDTGLTSDFLIRQLSARHPKSVKLCSLLHKPARSQVQVKIDYLGFTIDDVFVVGYGLDAAQLYRNLPTVSIYEA
jgi:hypoxanthine phosphoribosyltransferase